MFVLLIICLDIKKKRGSLYLLHVPLLKALASPSRLNERQRNPHRICLLYHSYRRQLQNYIFHTRLLPLPYSVTDQKVAKFQNVKNKTLSKRLSLCHVFPTMHPPPFGSGPLPENDRKYKHYFANWGKLLAVF
jgi:hypothetical protein